MRVALLGVALLATTSSALADEEVRYKGGPLPPNTHVETRRDDEIVHEGLLSFAGLYIMSVWAAGIAQAVCDGCTDHSYDLLYLPVAGPAIAAAMPAVQRLSPAWSVILVADSIGQTVSLMVAAVAYLLPGKRVIVKDASWHVAPTLGGLSFSATF
jgi:hypothetical protein